MKNLSTAMKSSPSSLHLEKAHMQQQRPSVAKKFKKQKQKNLFKKKKKAEISGLMELTFKWLAYRRHLCLYKMFLFLLLCFLNLENDTIIRYESKTQKPGIILITADTHEVNSISFIFYHNIIVVS